jgi:hypothetical protein
MYFPLPVQGNKSIAAGPDDRLGDMPDPGRGHIRAVVIWRAAPGISRPHECDAGIFIYG